MSQTFAARQFANNTSGHQLTVLHDDGLYRHLRCRKPGTAIWGWDIITWPGYLAIAGDLGGFTFRRESDMLAFFTGPVNPGYWLEKCVAWSKHSHPEGEVSLRRIREHLNGKSVHEDDCEALSELDGTPEFGKAVEILMAYDRSAWEWDIAEPDLHAVRALHAIAWTVKRYRATQEKS